MHCPWKCSRPVWMWLWIIWTSTHVMDAGSRWNLGPSPEEFMISFTPVGYKCVILGVCLQRNGEAELLWQMYKKNKRLIYSLSSKMYLIGKCSFSWYESDIDCKYPFDIKYNFVLLSLYFVPFKVVLHISGKKKINPTKNPHKKPKNNKTGDFNTFHTLYRTDIWQDWYMLSTSLTANTIKHLSNA